MSSDMFDEGQPSGVRVETTLAVVSRILADPAFAKEVVEHNGWKSELAAQEVALLFLTSRFQWAMDLLSRQTGTLRSDVDILQQRGAFNE